MEKWKSFGMLAATLVLGIIIGALVMRFATMNNAGHMKRGGPIKMMERVIKKVADPDETQQIKIEEVLSKFQQGSIDDHQVFRDRESKRLDAIVLELKSILKAEQFEKLETKMKEIKERHKRREAEEMRRHERKRK